MEKVAKHSPATRSPYERCRLPLAETGEDPAALRAYRAGMLLPVSAAPIADAVLVTRGRRLVALGPARETLAAHPQARLVADMPRAVVLPGLINAHCHLELSFMQGLIAPDRDFVAWIQHLLRLRRAWTDWEWRLSTSAGLRESLRGGCTALGDIVSEPSGLATLADELAPLRLRAFREFLGWPPEAREKSLAEAQALPESPPGDELHLGLSPHAPYSTHPELYENLLALAEFRRWPLATHGSETLAERNFMERGEGGFADLHRDLGWRDDTGRPWPGGQTLPRWLAARGLTVPCQFVHGTHLDEEEIALLAKLEITVVYCPGAVAFFHGGEDRHPVRRLQKAGVPVALGTDSFASSPSLNLPETCTLASRAHRELEPEAILEMATRAGAASLGFPDSGVLAEDGRADFVCFDLPGGKWQRQADEQAMRAQARDAIAGALLSGYRAASLTVFGGVPYAFAGLKPFPS